MIAGFSPFSVILTFIAVVLALKSFGINQEFQRGVVFRLGRITDTKGPGWFWLIPLIDRLVKVDLRTIREG
ncbi:MAG: hypothetical protein RIS52_1553 [Pseudomonadota bacterium]